MNDQIINKWIDKHQNKDTIPRNSSIYLVFKWDVDRYPCLYERRKAAYWGIILFRCHSTFFKFPHHHADRTYFHSPSVLKSNIGMIFALFGQLGHYLHAHVVQLMDLTQTNPDKKSQMVFFATWEKSKWLRFILAAANFHWDCWTLLKFLTSSEIPVLSFDN